MRGKKKSVIRFKSFSKKQLARQFARQRARQSLRSATAKLRSALSRFKPKVSDRGNIVFIGVTGKRDAAIHGRRGFAVYVDSKGRKNPIRQFHRNTGKLEKIPTPRKLATIDVGRVRSDRARKKFLTAHANKIIQGKIENVPSSRKIRKGGKRPHVPNGTIHSGELQTDNYYLNGETVGKLSKELRKAIKTSRGKRDFLVTIGVVCKTGNGDLFWITSQVTISRQQNQSISLDEARQFFGRVIYRLLAVELANRGLVLSGSAKHVQRLKINKGKPRSKWQKPYKTGKGETKTYLWEAHDYQDVKIQSVEYRFDRLHFK